MNRSPLLKVYGHIYPVDDAFFQALELACASALPDANADGAVVTREGDMARFSLEGMYFPLDEVLEVLHRFVRTEHQGKLDVLDLEAWRLTRHVFGEGQVHTSSAPLNNVLEYAGH